MPNEIDTDVSRETATVGDEQDARAQVNRSAMGDEQPDHESDVSRETAAIVNEHETAVGVQRAPSGDDAPTRGVSDVSRETEHAAALYAAMQADIAEEAEGGPLADVSRETRIVTSIEREAMRAVHVMNVRQEEWPRPETRRVMTVANQKGGVGKTTTAVNLAVALAQHGLRVLVVDLDPQGNASTALGVEHAVGTPSTYDVLLGSSTLSEVSVQVEVAETLRCVPATIDLAGADIELASQVAREYRLRKAIEEYSDEVDYILIDCPPALGLLTLNALVAGREILIPIQCEYYALEGLAQLLNTVALVKSQLNSGLEVSTVLLTMYDSRTKLADQVADEVRNHFGDKVIRSVIPRNVRVSEAPGYGQTVMTYDAGSRGAIGYLDAARELAARGAAMNDGGSGEQTSVERGGNE
ncbi:MAG TPA: ParA family protein [Jatrophihabitans sp.]|jgi:chromosome partitioning protein